MESKRPPNRYPKLITADIFGARGSTLTDSPISPGTALPPYGDEGAPPQYQEDGLDAKEKAAKKAKERKTLFVRLLTSIFITVLVSLIVAGVVGRIHDRQALERKLHKGSGRPANMTSIIVTQEASELQGTASTTTQPLQFTVVPTGASTAASLKRAAITFDCPYSYQTTATATADYGNPTEVATYRPGQLPNQRSSEKADVLGVSVFPLGNCLVARASYKGVGDDVTYQCTMSCED